ncbi:hypothetical protein [Tabrizicola sp.]|uniref:hypothetical protein n=1 Tax=Tabrizicola sp. TaxID=2005166 RepID=UPI003D2DE41B
MIQKSPCDRALISSEWLSTNIAVLKQAFPYIKEFNPKLIVVVRDEEPLVRSMYLQLVKGYLYDPVFVGVSDFRKAKILAVARFDRWWKVARHRFVYGRMLRGWIEMFGKESVIFIPYLQDRHFDIVDAVCGVLELEVHQRLKNRNRSIGPFAARSAILGSDFGRGFGKFLAQVSGKLERWFPRLNNVGLLGLNSEEVAEHYRLENEELAANWPDFSEALRAARSPRADH